MVLYLEEYTNDIRNRIYSRGGVLLGLGEGREDMIIHYIACYYGRPMVRMMLVDGWKKFQVLKIKAV